MLVSFIIPTYNASDTIVRCLESIYALPLKREEFEVIVVDDASSDNTVEVVEQYCQKVYGVKCKVYENFTLLRQKENRRQGAARNRGVSVAKGEYICFVDADDAVTDGIVEAIHTAADSKTEMTPYHMAYADEMGTITNEEVHLSFGEGQIFSGIEMQNCHPYWLSGPVAYVYSKAFLERVNYPFEEEVLFEDSDFVVVHLYHAKRMIYSSELGYIAYYREGSTTRSVTAKSLADYLLLGVRMLRFYESIVNSRESRVENHGVEQFADGILEGACWNVQKSCSRLMKLSNISEVRTFYERIDRNIDRSTICEDDRIRKYYWNIWTTISLGHRKIATIILSVVIPIYKLIKR